MPFNVNQFRTQLSGDGARPNLFEVRLNFPSYVTGRSTAQLKSTFMVKTAQLPGSTLGSVPVNYFGREVKVAGNRTFADWTVTVINDEDFIIRNAMESWVRGINDNVTNLRAALTTQQYAADAEVFQYSKAGGSPIKKYKFVGMFPIPSNISTGLRKIKTWLELVFLAVYSLNLNKGRGATLSPFYMMEHTWL